MFTQFAWNIFKLITQHKNVQFADIAYMAFLVTVAVFVFFLNVSAVSFCNHIVPNNLVLIFIFSIILLQISQFTVI